MPLLLTLLSVLAAWALLTVLVLGLLVILKALEGVRRNLEQVAMGVRAIEQQTAMLGSSGRELAGNLPQLSGGLEGLAEKLERTSEQLPESARNTRLH